MNYAIGRPWKGDDDSSVAFYAYFTEIHKGTIEDAESMKKYVESQTGKTEHIYIVTRLSQTKEIE